VSREKVEAIVGRNVEVKARASDFAVQRRRAVELAGGPPEVLHQEDTFFRSRRGRLKLRRFSDNAGELIHYEREDAEGPSESRYMIVPTSEPVVLRCALSKALGTLGTVVKRRELFLVEGTRIHLDEVEGLGEFLELEAVLGPGESRKSGEERVRKLSAALCIDDSDLIDSAYIDLLRKMSSKDEESTAAPDGEDH
jgi:predicted adenylyl cyclase CyaB